MNEIRNSICAYCHVNMTTNDDFICDDCHQAQLEGQGALPEATEQELNQMAKEHYKREDNMMLEHVKLKEIWTTSDVLAKLFLVEQSDLRLLKPEEWVEGFNLACRMMRESIEKEEGKLYFIRLKEEDKVTI